jgi:hypothetical protein
MDNHLEDPSRQSRGAAEEFIRLPKVTALFQPHQFRHSPRDPNGFKVDFPIVPIGRTFVGVNDNHAMGGFAEFTFVRELFDEGF